MPRMTDPLDALTSFQHALGAREIDPTRGGVDPNLYVHVDRPNGQMRLSYVRLEGKTVTVFVNFVTCDPVEGKPCFQVGYAVPEIYRRQGRARDGVSAAISEMEAGLGRNGISTFYVEAIVGADNLASRRVAENVISSTGVEIIDELSGGAALQYVRKVG